MRNGIYTIDSIEQGQAKLLWREDESIEELVELAVLGVPVKEGDLINIESLPDGLRVEILEEETNEIKEKVRRMKEQLLKRSEKEKHRRS